MKFADNTHPSIIYHLTPTPGMRSPLELLVRVIQETLFLLPLVDLPPRWKVKSLLLRTPGTLETGPIGTKLDLISKPYP